MMNTIYFGDNLPILQAMPSEHVDLIYIDPPFNTGDNQVMRRIVSDRGDGNRTGFAGQSYTDRVISQMKYTDKYTDYLTFIGERLDQSWRILKNTGSLFVHLDYREVHYVKLLLDTIFNRDNFRNEIIWAYDYGGRGKTTWPKKHDTILWYTKSDTYTFNYDAIDRIPYLAPGLVTKEKAERGKVPTDVWWNTIVPTNGPERTGYPNQKPLAILNRIIKVHSNENDIVLDFFAGSGSTGQAALDNSRNIILIDNNPDAIQVMRKRFAAYEIAWKS